MILNLNSGYLLKKLRVDKKAHYIYMHPKISFQIFITKKIQEGER